MPLSTLKYANEEITVVWKPDVCIHSRICWTELINVFNPSKRPWVNLNGSTNEKIMAQINKGPSGALSYFMNNEVATTPSSNDGNQLLAIEIKPNGPLLVATDCRIIHPDGTEEIKKGKTAFCRCGHSANKPYCDGNHRINGFTG